MRARKVPGVLDVVRMDAAAKPTQMRAGVAVVATNTWAAMQGRKALLLEWHAPDGEPESDARLHAAFTETIHAAGTVLRSAEVWGPTQDPGACKARSSPSPACRPRPSRCA